ncbi:MAG: nascent polypeptide-associated complex protein [Candidatus Bilamarchaeaceae archaeon]
MLGGMGGMDPRQMQKMMRHMGISSQEIAAERVIIEAGEERIIIEPAQVVKITMQGQSSFQVSGTARSEAALREEDISLVMEKANVSREKAAAALKSSGGDIAEAILQLQSEEGG